MLLRHTLLYLPAQIVGPLFQLIAMIVWTHVVDEHTLGVITLVTATHELLQIAFLTWWSQYALRYFGRYQNQGEVSRFYRTENAVLLVSVLLQSILAVAILLLVIAPDADTGLLVASVGYVITRTLNLYIGERARVHHHIWVYSIQQIVGPSAGFVIGLILIKLISPSAEWPLAGYALAQLVAAIIVLPKIGYGRSFWPFDREIVNQALHYGIPIVIGGALGWVGLNASRFIVNDMLGVAAAGLFAVGYGLGQRAAAVAAMLVTAAAFPLAVKSMEQSGSKVAMRQLADNSALLIAVLAPSIIGIYMLRDEIIHLLIAVPFQRVTLAVLPLSALAGSIRSLRAHFVDQTFLLHGRTRLMIVVAAIDATATVLLSFIFIRHWGLVGAAGATVVAAIAAAIVSFTIGFTKFGLTLPLNHLVPVASATAAMAALLWNLPEAKSLIVLTGHIAAGATAYVAVLVVLYAMPLLRMFRLRQQQSEP
jgi:O-antigen/teichoic acid export membrane protein